MSPSNSKVKPTTYFALLRGINVGGHNVSMEKLRGLFAELGLENVRSFIQTGNVFFESDKTDRAALERGLHAHLTDKLGYDVPVFLRTEQELSRVLEATPFNNLELTPETRHLVVFISKPLAPDLAFPVASPAGEFEILSATDGEAFVLLRTVKGKSGNAIAWVEKTFGVAASARFYHTTQKILDAAQK